MDDLTGKVAVITGGASGIGLAMGRAFAAEGMKIVLADIEAAALKEAAASFNDEVEVESVVCDVADAEQVDALRDTALARFGSVHVVCNNAGVSAGGLAWEGPLDDWKWVLGVNLWGVIHGIRSFTPLLIEQGEGHIVNTASMAGLVSPPYMATYNASKHAVVTLSETLYADLEITGAAGVGVSVLCPGWVRTRIHEAGRNRPSVSGAVDGETPALTEEQAGLFEVISGLIGSGIDPADVAVQVLDAVKARRFYVLTHPDWKPAIAQRADQIVAEENPRVAHLPM